MKKDKKKRLDKEQKKAAKKELTAQIKAALGLVLVNFAKGTKSTDKIIAKTTKQLVKKFSKIKSTLPIVAETPKVVVDTPEVVIEKSSAKKVKA